MSCTAQGQMELVNNHPCYSKEAHNYYARIHLPVAPACNIQCNYCNRKYDCSNESRPGVTSQKLSPVEGLKKVLFVGSKIKQLSVVGIAGPGDALANPKATFETFRLIREFAPDLKLCISTNGLALPFFIEELKKYNIDHVTVTINTLNPENGAKIYPWIYDTKTKKRLSGISGATLLVERQLEGIQKCIQNGILVKANSVLMPHINGEDLPILSKKLKSMGVFLHNIMPLLSEPEFGTYFGLNGIKSTTTKQLEEIQTLCEVDMNLMKHCKQCRADAVGLLGEDRSEEFIKDKFDSLSINELQEEYNIKERGKFFSLIEEFRDAIREGSKKAQTRKLVAITSSNNQKIDIHFGTAVEFFIYEIVEGNFRFLRTEKLQNPYCSGSDNCNGSNPIEEIKDKLTGIDYLMTVKIGECSMNELKKMNINIIQNYDNTNIEDALCEFIARS